MGWGGEMGVGMGKLLRGKEIGAVGEVSLGEVGTAKGMRVAKGGARGSNRKEWRCTADFRPNAAGGSWVPPGRCAGSIWDC